MLPNPFGEGAQPEDNYAGLREWRGENLISLLFRTSIKLQTTFDRHFSPFGITAQEAAVLVRCVEEGETSAGKLARAMGRDKGKITRFVNRLQASHLLTRTSDPGDRRLLIIRATSRGRRVAPRLRVIFDELRKQFFDAILTQDIDQLGFLLSQLYENAGRISDDSAPPASQKNSLLTRTRTGRN